MPAKKNIAWCQELAASRGGRCLDEVYVGAFDPIGWECSLLHRWEAIPSSVARGHWCPTCAGRPQRDITWCRGMAAIKGGRCLSEEYVNVKTKLTWECSFLHRWTAVPNNIQQGQWCPECKFEKFRIYKDSTCRKIAQNLRGRLNKAVRGKVKAGSAVSDLGISVSGLKQHLEFQWKPGMSWSNYGDDPGCWHIDHIKPLARFDLTDREQFLQACHYTNLQPMWKLDNLSKGARLDWVPVQAAA